MFTTWVSVLFYAILKKSLLPGEKLNFKNTLFGKCFLKALENTMLPGIKTADDWRICAGAACHSNIVDGSSSNARTN